MQSGEKKAAGKFSCGDGKFCSLLAVVYLLLLHANMKYAVTEETRPSDDNIFTAQLCFSKCNISSLKINMKHVNATIY